MYEEKIGLMLYCYSTPGYWLPLIFLDAGFVMVDTVDKQPILINKVQMNLAKFWITLQMIKIYY